MTPMMEIVQGTIEEIVACKKDGGNSPCLAYMSEIENFIRVDVKEALNQLVRAGLIEWHKDVNGNPMFGVKEVK